MHGRKGAQPAVLTKGRQRVGQEYERVDVQLRVGRDLASLQEEEGELHGVGGWGDGVGTGPNEGPVGRHNGPATKVRLLVQGTDRCLL